MPTNRKPNHLINEKSPYLLQHAYNPVNWYPWGEEALNKAKKENKPIFLSIGYSTCHWCHVMERESFEDERIARILNGRYVSIKVDREERPDLDSIYMKVCQQMTGHGGWPLNVFMTPDQVPFYAGTYFPPKSRYGIPSFEEVIVYLSEIYRNDPSQIETVTQDVQQALNQMSARKSDQRLGKIVTHRAYQYLEKMYDPNYGGFSQAPKFPTPHHMMFLLRYYHLNKTEYALEMVENTLKSMANGGLFDHIGFGFSRYSTDDEWLVPHFEKMLYDNALLLIAYIECYQVTKNPFYKDIAEKIIEFVNREMLSTEGGFYSAIDADSEGVEGKYYVWDIDEIYDVLGDELGYIFSEVYQISEQGNFEGKNIPNLIDIELEEEAVKFNLSINELKEKLDQAKSLLLKAREKRIYPHIDDKILTSWNSMMIVGLAKAGHVLKNEDYIQLANQTLEFIENKLIINGRLMARYRDGETKYNGYIDDYAYLVWAYLSMYEATFQIKYLTKAIHLTSEAIKLFWDNEEGGFFFNGIDGEKLIINEKEIHDGALPSGNSVFALTLAKLAALTGETKYTEYLEKMYHIFYDEVSKYPYSSTFFLQALLFTEYPSKEVVVLGEAEDTSNFVNKLNENFLPNIVFLVGTSSEQLVSIAPFVEQYKKINEKLTIYICENFSCQKPTNDFNEAINQIISS